MVDNYLKILSFLKKYGGNQYKKLDKCSSNEERDYMVSGSEAGKFARAQFTELVEIIEKSCSFEHDKVTQWQNSGTYVSYLWCQMKRKEHKDSQISMSLFAEKGNDFLRFRLSIELAMAAASTSDITTYAGLLNVPLDPMLVYVSGGNNESEFRILDERDNTVVKAMKLKKVQISYIITEDDYTNDAALCKSLLGAAEKLVSYYDELFELHQPSKPKSKEGEKPMPGLKSIVSSKEAVTEIKNYIFNRGFDYPDGMVENFYLSLKSKPFVILAGISGTGKTRLVKLFAEAIGADYRLVSVRPDWSDGSDLFGHTDLNGHFIQGPVCSAFDAAVENPDKPVFLCFDEMNLARVEYYLSDFLSVIESRYKSEGRIKTEGIAQYEGGIPDNLYVVGTVNMDETTFPFSKKVLDRANTIEFSYVDLIPQKRTVGTVEPQALSNSFLCTEYLILAIDCAEEEDFVQKVCVELQEMNKFLAKANANVGFRVRDEIVFYMLNNKKAGELLTYNQAMDNQIMQKILPRIQGSSFTVKTLLIDLFKFCSGSASGIDADTGNVGEQMRVMAYTAKYPESAKKIGYMMTRFEDDGFTSYWL